MSSPIGAVQASNAQKGVKRPLLNNPVNVPSQLPGFRGRVVDAGAPIKVPKLRNGNLNNETSNVRVPYSRVTPLEFLSSYTGRLSPGDVVFVHKYPPGFVSAQQHASNATLGVNTLSRVVGLDGLNRLLMGSNPDGWQVGKNVLWLNKNKDKKLVPSDVTSGGNVSKFMLSVLDEYRLDGVVISNDEPGAFTSSGARDNALFNVAIQGPTEVNNGFLEYEEEQDQSKDQQFNPLTGQTNTRTVEAHARGSAESGRHLTGGGGGVPGRVGSPWLGSGKTDFVANFCGTYSMYPSQMFDRRVETLNSLYLGLRAYELSTASKKEVKDEMGHKIFKTEAAAENACMVFYQYMPFSSRAAAVVDAVTSEQLKGLSVEGAEPFTIAKMEEDLSIDQQVKTRAAAAKRVKAASFRKSALNDVNAPFDKRSYDAVRTNDLRNMVGAWHVGRVLDTRAARHDPYAGGPRDTAFACIVDVGLSWRSARAVTGGEDSPPDRAPLFGATREEKGGQQNSYTLANCAQPALGGKNGVLGEEFGRYVTGARRRRQGDCWVPPMSYADAATTKIGATPAAPTPVGTAAEAAISMPGRQERAAAVPTGVGTAPAAAAATTAAAAAAAAGAPPAAVGKAPSAAAATAPTGAKPPGAAAPTGAKPPGAARARSKTPPPRSGRAAPPGAAPPGAASASSRPLVPTTTPIVEAAAATASARASGAPRRRAREGGESSSTTNSVFETMFEDAAPPEEPASPTPSDGSDQSARNAGPRTFRRINR
jgi:hypothetical protein